MKIASRLLTIFLSTSSLFLSAQELTKPTVTPQVVFEEKGGILSVEAEYFYKQTADDVRQWHLTFPNSIPEIEEDPDEAHINGASNHAYIEILPDTRTTHDDKLTAGVNFMNEAGKMAIVHYKVFINNPGRYYVWVRTHSTGTEDNGVHVGIDGKWPEHGQRMQWTAKNQWFWDNKQRTKEVHVGVPMEIYLDIDQPGEHEIHFSMREDGFEFDKFLLVKDKDFRPEQNTGPKVTLHSGALPTLPKPDGNGEITIMGELKEWHKVTLALNGPYAHELDNDPNPFMDYRMNVVFTHESGRPIYRVPGYFAADGNAAESSASEGNIWLAHFSPDQTGNWTYRIEFETGEQIAVQDVPWSREVNPYHKKTGIITIDKSDKKGRDFRSKGRLEYVGKHFLQFQGDQSYFLKAGADAPETLLAYSDFDDTYTVRRELKTWEKHIQDWNEGDPTWKGDKGMGLIGAVNYLSEKGANSFSFLTYNAGGDGDNVWPFVKREDKYHYDCSKLAQWQILFDHAQFKGMYLHFKTQETENDDHRKGKNNRLIIQEALDGGELGPQRRLYYRELIARYSYLLALNWNLGEENTQTSQQQRDMAAYFDEVDPYDHNIVLHTYPNQQEKVYEPLLQNPSKLTGFSLQNHWAKVHERTLQWLKASVEAGKPLVIANDEQGSASEGVPPDPGYPGFDSDVIDYDLHDIRKQTLWGNLMAGGAGVEYYFGYKLPENDLVCEDFRSRDKSWEYAAIALNFFNNHKIPFWEMNNRNDLIENPSNGKEKYCLAKSNELYLVYLGYAQTSTLDLTEASGTFDVSWFNPRTGEALLAGRKKSVKAGKVQKLGNPPKEMEQDWLVVVRKRIENQ